MSQTASPGARLRTGSHRLWRQHCRILLAEAGAADPGLRADALLAALTAEQVRHWRHDEGRSLAGLTSAITDYLVARSTVAAPGRRGRNNRDRGTRQPCPARWAQPARAPKGYGPCSVNGGTTSAFRGRGTDRSDRG